MSPNNFDDSKPFETVQFDETQPFESVDAEEREIEISPVESALLGAGNSALANLGKPLLAGVQTGIDKLSGDKRAIGDIYNQNKGLAGEVMGMAEEQNPVASGAGSIAGAVASPINKFGAAAGALSGAAAGYQAGEEAGQNPLIGAAMGGVIGGATHKAAGTMADLGSKVVNTASIYAKPLTDAIQRESDTVAPSFVKAAAKALTGQPFKATGEAMAATSINIAKVIERAPEKLGRFAPVLKQAAERGTLPVTTYLLSQMSPEYRQQMAEINSDE